MPTAVVRELKPSGIGCTAGSALPWPAASDLQQLHAPGRGCRGHTATNLHSNSGDCGAQCMGWQPHCRRVPHTAAVHARRMEREPVIRAASQAGV